jgi:hypothetical protein
MKSGRFGVPEKGRKNGARRNHRGVSERSEVAGPLVGTSVIGIGVDADLVPPVGFEPTLYGV